MVTLEPDSHVIDNDIEVVGKDYSFNQKPKSSLDIQKVVDPTFDIVESQCGVERG